MQTERTTLAYLAGIIDADGFITIQRSTRTGVVYYGPVIGISGTRKEPHELAASIWGGTVSKYKPKHPGHLPQFQWSRMGKSGIPIIEEINEFLLIKKEQADLALSIWEHLQFSRTDDPFPWYGPDYDYRERCEKVYLQMVSLNQSRKRLRSNSQLFEKSISGL